MADTLTSAPVMIPPQATMPNEAPPTKEKKPREMLKGGYYHGTGRRKTAVARVRMKPGEGKFIINRRPAEQYFNNVRDREDIIAPLRIADNLGKMDVHVSVFGGGPSGQAGAIVLGVARALVHYNPQVEPKLRDAGFLTRDAREVERKKYGQSGARRRFQFSKR